jgi:hypothetical protein
MTRPIGGYRTFDPAPILSLPKFCNLMDDEIAADLDVTVSALRSWKGGRRVMSVKMADHVALRLGLHPTNVWDGWEHE